MDSLKKILSSLQHLDLEGQIVRKQPVQSGLGGTCDVFTAWSNRHDRKVAVKCIRVFMRRDEAFAKKLAKEIRIWAKLEHECVLPLLGYLVEGEDMMPSMVSEWMERGSLNDFMKKFPRGGVDTWNMLNWIASGLEYIHSQGVVHADLKSHNILISDSFTPLLADFGLSTALSQTTVATATCTTNGTVRWMAIELLNCEQTTPTKRTDVWAFGMVAYELLSGNLPYYQCKSDLQVIPVIIKGGLPSKPDNEHDFGHFDTLWRMCLACWDNDPVERPTATELSYLLSTDPTSESDDMNVLGGVRSESPIDMSYGFPDDPEEPNTDVVVPLPYVNYVRDLALARQLSMPDAAPRLKARAVGSPMRSTYPQRKASMQSPENRLTIDNMRRTISSRQAVGQRSPVPQSPSSPTHSRATPSKKADGQILFQLSDADGVPLSPGRQRKWALYDASLTNSNLDLERSDKRGAKLSIPLRNISGKPEYDLKAQESCWNSVEGNANSLRVYPFALVGKVNSKLAQRFAAVKEEERNMWMGAFTEVADVQVLK
ncbi:kinase-like protein [Schizopora paradoxa]|uniref:Kinase-like protein n=1 Tax=Schizopora paradoxa TaxID=27342 RepID=A0A0H2S1E3_9AGAM|nr:kinase-like protein [Schizopora paradoxa]